MRRASSCFRIGSPGGGAYLPTSGSSRKAVITRSRTWAEVGKDGNPHARLIAPGVSIASRDISLMAETDTWATF